MQRKKAIEISYKKVQRKAEEVASKITKAFELAAKEEPGFNQDKYFYAARIGGAQKAFMNEYLALIQLDKMQDKKDFLQFIDGYLDKIKNTAAGKEAAALFDKVKSKNRTPSVKSIMKILEQVTKGIGQDAMQRILHEGDAIENNIRQKQQRQMELERDKENNNNPALPSSNPDASNMSNDLPQKNDIAVASPASISARDGFADEEEFIFTPVPDDFMKEVAKENKSTKSDELVIPKEMPPLPKTPQPVQKTVEENKSAASKEPHMNAFIFEKLAAHRRGANNTSPQSAKDMAKTMHKNIENVKKTAELPQEKAKAPLIKDAAQPKNAQLDDVQQPVTPKPHKR